MVTADTCYSILLQRRWELCKSMTEVLLVSWSAACHTPTKLKLRDTILKHKPYCRSSRGSNPILQFTSLQLISPLPFPTLTSLLPPLAYFWPLSVQRPYNDMLYFNWWSRILCFVTSASCLYISKVLGQRCETALVTLDTFHSRQFLFMSQVWKMPDASSIHHRLKVRGGRCCSQFNSL